MKRLLSLLLFAAVAGCAHVPSQHPTVSTNERQKALEEEIATLQLEDATLTRALQRMQTRASIMNLNSEDKARLQRDILQQRVRLLQAELEIYWNAGSGPY
jgi:hypothetical protein